MNAAKVIHENLVLVCQLWEIFLYNHRTRPITVDRFDKAFYSSRPGSAWDFTNVRLIFMNDSFIKCVSSIMKYWRNVLITEENEWINQPHSVLHPGLYCRWPWFWELWLVASLVTPVARPITVDRFERCNWLLRLSLWLLSL